MKYFNYKKQLSFNEKYISFFICLVFSLCGGFMDTFSYIMLGKVFANAQTGNLIFMGINLYQGFISEALHFLIPIFFFALGVFSSLFIEHILNLVNKKLFSKTLIILIEIAVFSLIPKVAFKHPYISNTLISFICGLQLETFKNFSSIHINTTMCVGNLRTASRNLSLYLTKKNYLYLKNFIIYTAVILSFILGAILGNFFINLLGIYAIYVCNIFLLIPLSYHLLKIKTSKKSYI